MKDFKNECNAYLYREEERKKEKPFCMLKCDSKYKHSSFIPFKLHNALMNLNSTENSYNIVVNTSYTLFVGFQYIFFPFSVLHLLVALSLSFYPFDFGFAAHFIAYALFVPVFWNWFAICYASLSISNYSIKFCLQYKSEWIFQDEQLRHFRIPK